MPVKMSITPLADHNGRTASYLRISITDRCNLNCLYCRGKGEQKFIPHKNILRYEEILRLLHISRKMGIARARITGGEPFMRRDCIELLAGMRREFADLAISITSNGTLLEPWLQELAKIRLQAINISLDSLKKDIFAQITGSDLLDNVLKNIDRLLRLSVPIKINAVALKGYTEAELDDYLHLAKTMPVDIRFIEFMPIGAGSLWDQNLFLSSREIYRLIALKTNPHEIISPENSHAGPAKMYALPGYKGRIGFISSISGHFCKKCNRLRLTSDGRLRTCLYSDHEYRLSGLLRNKKISEARIASVLSRACAQKPLGSELLSRRGSLPVSQRCMTGIGG